MYNPTTNTITTTRLILRPFTLDDAPRLVELCNNYNIYKSTLTLPYPYTIESALSWIPTHQEGFEQDSIYNFAITDKTTGIQYGSISLSNNKAHKNGEIAYMIGEEYWGRGYATEALKALVHFAFTEKGYRKVWGRFFTSNPASGKVMEKIGMTQEGLQKAHVLKDGQPQDMMLYGLLKEDFQ